MSESEKKTSADFVLPPSVASKTDLSRLVDELEWVDNELTTASVRTKTGSRKATKPAMSDHLADFLNQNKLKLDNSNERSQLIKQMRQLKDKVPVIHMTFAVPADPESLRELVQWLRTSVHPQAVIKVGLQPALVAGVYLRTPNRVHDLSLRGILKGRRDVLVKELETLREGS